MVFRSRRSLVGVVLLAIAILRVLFVAFDFWGNLEFIAQKLGWQMPDLSVPHWITLVVAFGGLSLICSDYFTGKSADTDQARETQKLPLDIVTADAPPAYDQLSGFQTRRVGITNLTSADLTGVNVWLSDINNEWKHNLGDVPLRQKDDLPRPSHLFRRDATIIPGNTMWFDMVEDNSSSGELLLCYADNASPAYLPRPKGHYVFTIKAGASNIQPCFRKFHISGGGDRKLSCLPFGPTYRQPGTN
jgi:hypothetical protein